MMRRFTTLAIMIPLAGIVIVLAGPERVESAFAAPPQQRAQPARLQRQAWRQQRGRPSRLAPRAQRHERSADAFPGRHQIERLRMLRALGLTPEQRRRARDVYRRFGPKVQQLRDELEERQDALHQAIFSEPYQDDLVEQRIQAVLEKQEELLRAQLEVELAFREILTPEQLAKFRDLQAQQLEIRRLQREIREKRRRLNQQLQPDQR